MDLDRHELGPGVHAAFTDRRGGISGEPYATLNLGGATGDDPAAVTENRGRVAAALELAPERVLWLGQVHGADVAVATGPWPGEPPAVDAAVSQERDIALAVRVADCTPVLLADADAGVIGATHAGRPGLAARVVPATVAKMCALGADPARMAAAVGPAICGRCYEVPAAMRDEVVAASGVARAAATTSWGTPAVDVPGGVVAQLRDAGVVVVTDVGVCTRESASHFSYRRDGETGRFAGYVWADA